MFDTARQESVDKPQPIYRESFEDGSGGWVAILRNGADGVQTPERCGNALVSRSPWWIDYNHAPPGAGYLHLLFCLHTTDSPYRSPAVQRAGGDNHFISNHFPLNFTNARLTARLRGRVELNGAQCVVLVQSKVGNRISPHLLTSQPLKITPEYSSQTVTLSPHETSWTSLGSRHDRTETYGHAPVKDVLQAVNVDIMLVLFPLNIIQMPTFCDDPHLLRAGEDYKVDPVHLPTGFIMLDEIEIEFAS